MVLDSAVGIATRYGLKGQGSNTGGNGVFRPRRDQPTQLPVDEYRVFPRVKPPVPAVDRPPSSSAGVRDTVQLYQYSSSGPSWPLLGWTLVFSIGLWEQLLHLRLYALVTSQKSLLHCGAEAEACLQNMTSNFRFPVKYITCVQSAFSLWLCCVTLSFHHTVHYKFNLTWFSKSIIPVLIRVTCSQTGTTLPNCRLQDPSILQKAGN